MVENIFWTNENVFLSPFNKQKQRFRELEFKYFGGSDVVNKLIVKKIMQPTSPKIKNEFTKICNEPGNRVKGKENSSFAVC